MRSGPIRPRHVDVVDETFIDAPPRVVADVLTDARNAANVWPHVRSRLIADRGAAGALWAVDGLVCGEFEVWLEPWWDGVIVHHYVRASTTERPRAVERAHVRRWKRFITAVKDALEPTRRTWSFEGGQSVRPLSEQTDRR